MSDKPSHDDQFADLFGKLPSPTQRAVESQKTDSNRSPESDAPVGAPLSRREARRAAASATTGDTSSPAGGSVPVTAPREDAPMPSVPAKTESASPQLARSGYVAPSAALAGAPDEPGPRRGATTIDALFGDDSPSSHEFVAQKRHDRDRRKSRIAGWVVFGVILALFGGLVAGGALVWTTYEDRIRAFMGWEEPKDFEAGMAEGEAVVTIVQGDTGASISTTLFEAGVTKTSDAFYSYLISNGLNPNFMPGVYALQQQMTSAAALEALEDPENKRENTAQLREGLTVEQSLTRLADGIGIPVEDFETAVADPSVYGVDADTLEGWLFPATYTFDPGVTAEDVIQRLVDRTISSLDSAGVPVDQRQEILTIASIIEREARLDEDFYRVSRVIQNRLDIDMLLQMDSTSQYGYGQLGDGSVSTSEEAQFDDNLWNTYVHPGLPVGPIANPGDVAIDAAMNPIDGPWLYFVTVNQTTGETIFSATYQEHLVGVEQFRQWCRDNPNSGC